MAQSTKNSGKEWAQSDVAFLKKLVKGNTPTGVMSIKLGRTEAAIRAKASELGVSLKPTNQSPYNRRKK
jgi:LPS sulfotransferase NodH